MILIVIIWKKKLLKKETSDLADRQQGFNFF